MITETGLWENLQSDYLSGFRQAPKTQAMSLEIIYAKFGPADTVEADPDRRAHGITNETDGRPNSGPKPVDPATDLARCFLRLANLPSYPLDRLSRYEAILWRQAGQILFALDALDRRKPQERRVVSVSVAGNTCQPTSAMSVDFRVSRLRYCSTRRRFAASVGRLLTPRRFLRRPTGRRS